MIKVVTKIKNLLELVKKLNSTEQKSINGGFGGGCNILLCTAESEGCPCFLPTTSTDGTGICSNGICYDC